MEDTESNGLRTTRKPRVIKTPHNGLLTISQAADYVGLATATMYKMVMRKDVASYRLNEGRVMLKPGDLDAWVERQRRPSQIEDQARIVARNGGRK